MNEEIRNYLSGILDGMSEADKEEVGPMLSKLKVYFGVTSDEEVLLEALRRVVRDGK